MAEASKLVARNAPPCDYLFKIESLSLITESSIQKFCSDDFEAGGYKWKLWIYPTGNKIKDGKDHISIYLEIMDRESLPLGWEVTAISKFFVFNYLQNKYLSTKDGLETRYHDMNTISGIDKFIPVDTFSNSENGYVLDDNCAFGVEIFFTGGKSNVGCLSMISKPTTIYHTWKVSNFSALADPIVSETFGCNKWNILLYRNGELEAKGNSISIYLALQKSITEETRLLAKFVLRVKNQTSKKHVECKLDNLYTPSNYNGFGWRRFMSLEKLKEGFLVDDTLIIEAEVTMIGSIVPKS